ncbi:hypothetical protein A2U01_0105731, partial [Trifolium medium]|nr:hypothetical protein [Trifolium medium]
FPRHFAGSDGDDGAGEYCDSSVENEEVVTYIPDEGVAHSFEDSLILDSFGGRMVAGTLIASVPSSVGETMGNL